MKKLIVSFFFAITLLCASTATSTEPVNAAVKEPNISDSSENVNARILTNVFAEKVYDMVFRGDSINDETGEFPDFPYSDDFKADIAWYREAEKELWTKGNVRAYYLQNPIPTNKTVILVHGFSSSPLNMGGFAKVYHDLGYNVLTPELRGHGQSPDRNRTMGFLDKHDVVNWAKEVVTKIGEDSEIVFSGQSLGAATTMMASALPDLPKNVVGVVADCGFSDLSKVVKNTMNSLPSIPFANMGKIYNRVNTLVKQRQQFQIEDVSPVALIGQSTLPILFICGTEDAFFEMLPELRDASGSSNKTVEIFDDAGHPESIVQDLPRYIKINADFLAQLD